MTMKRSFCLCTAIASLALTASPLAVFGQEHGSGGGGGGGGCGDVFGDLIHVLRDDVTGQPVLAKRWVEMPAELPGYGWGYCPIAVYHEDGEEMEIPFLPFSCDFDLTNPDDPDGEPLAVEEVDYFGRLNGGRTKERNNRMHFDEVISNIQQSGWLGTDPTGRFKLGFDCDSEINGACYDWATVDSPMESMALYLRSMKYGHLATDPYEINTWSHGDPKLLTQFHPALRYEDFAKFIPELGNLLPDPKLHVDAKGNKTLNSLDDCWDYSQAELITDDVDEDGEWDPYEPFYDMDEDCEWDSGEPFEDVNLDGIWNAGDAFIDENGNCVRDDFVFLCAGREPLDQADFINASSFLAAAASKTGFITVDLVQYVNRILKITKDTGHTLSTLDTLPALVRDCWKGEDPFEPDYEPMPWEELDYAKCDIKPADDSLVNYEFFPDVQEMFVDFKALKKYERKNFDGKDVDIILNEYDPMVWEPTTKDLEGWLNFVNGENPKESNIKGFVWATGDGVRAIEYIHNYDIPEDLYCKYDSEECSYE